MTVHNQILLRANQAISEWSDNTDRLVVGIDGYPGVGKTSLVADLAKLNPKILAVSQDDFITEWPIFQLILDQAERSSDDLNGMHPQQRDFQEFLVAYKSGSSKTPSHSKQYDFSKPILVVEGIFLFHPKRSNHLLDRRIFLTGDRRTIDERRVAREQARWGKDYVTEDHPDSYFRSMVEAFDRYVETQHPEQRADLVLSTTEQ